MPFKKGNTISKGNKGGGRKGYEYEQKQLKKMRTILNRSLALTERMQKAQASPLEAMAYENSIKMALKIMDKLHANKQSVELEVKEPISIRWEK